MKKLALTSLIILIGNKLVSACSYAGDLSSVQQELIYNRHFEEKLIGITILVLILAISFSFFVPGKKNFWIVITAFTSLIVSFLIAVNIETSCGNPFTLTIVKTESAFLAVLFIYQISSWNKQKRILKINLP